MEILWVFVFRVVFGEIKENRLRKAKELAGDLLSEGSGVFMTIVHGRVPRPGQ